MMLGLWYLRGFMKKIKIIVENWVIKYFFLKALFFIGVGRLVDWPTASQADRKLWVLI